MSGGNKCALLWVWVLKEKSEDVVDWADDGGRAEEFV